MGTKWEPKVWEQKVEGFSVFSVEGSERKRGNVSVKGFWERKVSVKGFSVSV